MAGRGVLRGTRGLGGWRERWEGGERGSDASQCDDVGVGLWVGEVVGLYGCMVVWLWGQLRSGA